MHAYRSALVTGASSGIGEAFARQLGAAGCSLVLVARRADRLEELAARLRERHGVHVEVLVADLADSGELGKVEQRLREPERPVELLVNNAGFATEGKFAVSDIDVEERQILVNVLAPARLTRAVLPAMLESRHGGVLNVSSVAGLLSAPGMATYNATKAFVTSFSESVRMEAGGGGVHVTALLPGLTRTEFQQRSGIEPADLPELAWLDAERVARAGLRAVRAGEPVCVPSAQYAGAAALLRLVPRRVMHRVVPRVWPRP